MNYSCKELKRVSRQSLLGKYGFVILAYILVQLIVSIVMTPFESRLQEFALLSSQTGQLSAFPWLSIIAILIIALVSVVLVAGLSLMQLNIARGNNVPISIIFRLFKERPDRFIVVSILLGLIAIACILPGYGLLTAFALFSLFTGDMGLLLMIICYALMLLGGVVAVFFTLRFSLSIYCLLDDINLSAVAAMKRSFQLMKGHCKRLLYVYFSFIPMILLVLLSFGIAALWIQPYMENVMAWFYLDVSGELAFKEQEARRMEEEMGPVLDDISAL